MAKPKRYDFHGVVDSVTKQWFKENPKKPTKTSEKFMAGFTPTSDNPYSDRMEYIHQHDPNFPWTYYTRDSWDGMYVVIDRGVDIVDKHPNDDPYATLRWEYLLRTTVRVKIVNGQAIRINQYTPGPQELLTQDEINATDWYAVSYKDINAKVWEDKQ